MTYLPTSIIVSLSEPVSLIQGVFRTLAEIILHTQRTPTRSLDSLVKYDFSPYLHALLKEMFTVETLDYKIPESTKILMKDGLQQEDAEILTNDVQSLIISQITRHYPEASFNNLDCELVEGEALYICIPPDYPKDDDDEV